MASLSRKRHSSRFTITVVTVVCIAMLVMALGLLLGGCGKASLVGKWLDATDNSVTEFKADGTVVAPDLAGVEATYKAEGGKITLSVAGAAVLTFDYALDGDKLTVTDPETNEPLELTRVK